MTDEAREPAGMKVSEKLDPLPARVACDVLHELRLCHRTRNYAPVKGLAEELQMMFDRMESALEEYGSDYGGIGRVQTDVQELKRERRKLKAELHKLRTERGELRDQKESDTDDLETLGAPFIHLLRSEMGISLSTAGAFFKQMRKAGWIIYRQKDNKDE